MRCALRRCTWILLAALLACGGPGAPPLTLEEIPAPDLTGVDDSVRQELEDGRARIGELIDRDAPAAELAAAVGDLGRLDHAYGFQEAAAVCFEKAAELAPEEFRWPYYRGYLLQERGDLDAAAAAFGRALELRPGDAPALYRLAEVELDRGRPEAASGLYRRALESDPGFSAAHHGLGRAALALDDHAAAVEHLERALAAQPEATLIHHSLGLAYRGAGDLEQARLHLARQGDGAVRLSDPLIAELETRETDTSSHLARGLEAAKRGDRATARRELEAAIAADPDDLDARHNLAVALTRGGQIGAAVEQYEEILARDPGNAKAHYNLGSLRGQQGDLERATEHFRAAVEAAPDFKQALFNLGAALARAGRWREAVAEYDRVIALDAEFSSVRYFRAVALVEGGEIERGLAELRELARQQPADPQPRLGLASIHERRGETAAALEVLAAGLEAAPAPAGARLHLEMARLLLAAGRREEATGHLASARELDPDLVEAAVLEARLLMRSGEPGRAAAEMRALVAARPDAVAARVAEADALALAGDFAAARRRLEEGHQQFPQNGNLAHALARLLAACPDPSLRDGERALTLARGLFAARRSPEHAETLALALAEAGRFAEAAELQSALVEEARKAGVAAPERFERNLERYRRGEPGRLSG